MTLTPPLAPKRPHPITQHGQTRVDDYFWLRDRNDPEVLRYLEAENAYTEAQMAPTGGLQETLYAEMRGRLAEDDASVPVRHGEWFYYQRYETGRQYALYCRKRGSLAAPEEILLDVNALAEGRDFCRIGNFEVSPDHATLAYAVDFSGAEHFTLFFKDLRTGQVLPETFTDTYYTLAWAGDSRTLFFVTLDAATRPYRVWRHTLGADPARAALVYEETDESYFVSLSRSRSGRYLFIYSHNNTTSEWRSLPADQPHAAFTVFAPRRSGVEYRLDHHRAADGAERFLMLTNDGAQNFKLMATGAGAPAQWQELVPHRPDVLLDGFDVFRDHLVVYEREAGLRHIRLSDPTGGGARRVPFPEPVYTFWTNAWMGPEQNPEYDARVLRFTYSSLVTPDSVIDYGLDDGAWTVRKVMPIPSGYDPALYQSERLMATAADGARVPISLVYRRGTPRDGRAPLLLYGYGAYGATVDPTFNTNRLSLLDRGVIYAIAHIRGGSDLGRAWYEDGKLFKKRNTFTDFIACAEHLIAQAYTAPDRLAALGVSAGGLLMGAVTTMRPDLFRCVVAKVPFVDVLNTMSDPTIPLTVIEWEEWGNPADPAAFEYMRSYSPYDNIQARAYPALLATAGFNDPRVAYWEPAKFVAKLRALKTDSNRLLLKTNLGAGHAGASGRFDYLKEIAFEYAFILDCLGAA